MFQLHEYFLGLLLDLHDEIVVIRRPSALKPRGINEWGFLEQALQFARRETPLDFVVFCLPIETIYYPKFFNKYLHLLYITFIKSSMYICRILRMFKLQLANL